MFRFSLENGMRVLVDPSGRSDVAAVHLWINVGSADEPPGMEGAAHVVEHMVFKGTRSYGVGEVASAVEALGGDLNAWTSFDETVFHATMPSAAAPTALGVLAEMLRSARFDAGELARERKVILEEIRGAQDDPDDVLSEATYAAAWPTHPYGRPIIGTVRSVRGMSREALLGFYERNYQPANTCLAVVGPVDVDAVRHAVNDAFGGGAPAPVRGSRTATAEAGRTRTLRRGFEAALVDLAFPGPGHGDAAVPALDVLCTALGGGASSPLEARLRLREGICISAEAGYSPERDGGMAVVTLHAREGAATSAVAAAREEIARARGGALGEEEVARARSQILAHRVFGRETVDGRAHELVFHAERMGGPDAGAAYDAAVARVTPEEVAEAARRWLTPERELATALLPAGERISFRRSNATSVVVDAPATSAPQVAPKRPRAVAERKIERFVLDNGLRVLLDPDDGEVAAVRVVGLGGSLGERRGTAGRSTAWARASLRGAGGLDAVGFATAVEALAGTVGAPGGRSSQGVRGEFVADRFEEGLELVGALVREPAFDPAEVERVRAEQTEALAEREDHPEHVLGERVWAAAYGDHPYGLSLLGTPGSVARVTSAGLRAAHRRWAVGKNLVVAVSGGFDPDHVRQRLTTLFGPLPEGERLEMPEAPVLPAETRRVTVRSGREQAHVAWAFPGVSVNDPLQPEVELLAAVLGGQGGRLFMELREAHGLAYSVGASSHEGLQQGLFVCSVATDPERLAEAEARLGESLARVAQGSFTDEEVERARRYMLGGIEVELQTAGARSNLAVYTELYGQDGLLYRSLVRRRLLGVTADDVRRCAARVLARPVVLGRLVPAERT